MRKTKRKKENKKRRERVCESCKAPLKEGEVVCPECGSEQPIRWLNYLVYVFLGIFLLGALKACLFGY